MFKHEKETNKIVPITHENLIYSKDIIWKFELSADFYDFCVNQRNWWRIDQILKSMSQKTCKIEISKNLWLSQKLFRLDWNYYPLICSQGLCNSTNTSKCNTVGTTFISGACHIGTDNTCNRIAFVQDRAAFDGIQTASHELGHLYVKNIISSIKLQLYYLLKQVWKLHRMGSSHDLEKTGKCQDDNGYIMTTYNRFSNHSFDWSPCSINEIDKFIR